MRALEVTVEELLGRPLTGPEARSAPATLYVVGGLSIPIPAPRVSVVGTRRPSERGIELAREIVGSLVREGAVVVSGLARGIDTVAHTAAIEGGGRTVAVLGTPLDVFYPPENRELQLRLMREHMVVSQFPIGWPVARRNFPMRNRLMALLSDATVVVEAGELSGVVHQARECVRLGRPLLIHKALGGLAWVGEAVKRGALLFDGLDDFRRLWGFIYSRGPRLERFKWDGFRDI